MREMDLLCPSEQELREVMRLYGEGLPLVAYRLLEATQSRAAIVTLGADGLIAFSPIKGAEDAAGWTTRLHSEHLPALCPIALDPLGCGDSLLSVATLALAGGGSLVQAGFLGACAAAVQVQRLGNIAVTPADLRSTIARVQSSRLVFAGERVASGLQNAAVGAA
jgi:sugar/nucleoside kinase (ribokinase family)